MTDLDYIALRAILDPEGAYERNRDLPQQFRQAEAAVQGFSLPDDYRDIDNVIIAGMGGSAIAADFLQTLCFRESTTPVTVVRGYEIPKWANARTLFIACSHSGNTEETLSDFEAARRDGCKIVAITTGGRMMQLVSEAGLPFLSYEYYPEPRSAFGHGFVRLLVIARAAGFLDVKAARLDAAIAELESMQDAFLETTPLDANPAKALAARLHDRLSLTIGAEFLSPVARRWKGQFNENGDTWAMWEELPELHHNTVVGLGQPAEIASRVHAIILEHPSLSDRICLRCDVTAELFDHTGVSYERIQVGGSEPLAAMLRAVYFGSMVSYYLALHNNVHPTEMDNINNLKARLS